MSGLYERLWEQFESYLQDEGVELDDLEVKGRGGGRMVRVLIDAPGGVDVERVASLSRGLSRLLDEEDELSGPFTLEVGSPGLERSLRRPAHYEKAIGREVVLKTRRPVAGSQSHRGVLDSVSSGEVSIRVDEETRLIPIEAVAQARTVFRWERSPKPGRKRGS